MANYKNIKPYADFAHTAAVHGGVSSYLNEIESASYDNGYDDGAVDTIKGISLLLIGGIAIYECVKKVLHTKKENRERNSAKIEEAKAAIEQEVYEKLDANMAGDNL